MVIVILVLGGYFGLGWYERKVEQNILTEMKLMPSYYTVSADSVDYSFFSGEIVFTNVKERLEIADQVINSTYTTILVKKPNLDVFQGTAKPGLVPVAEKVQVADALITSEDGKINYAIKDIRADNMKVDAYAIREIYTKGGTLSAVLSKALEGEYTHVEYNGMVLQAKAPLPDGQEIALNLAVRSATADNMAKQRIGAAKAEGIVYDLPEGISLKIDDLSIKNMFIPDFGPIITLPEHRIPAAMIKAIKGERLLEGFAMNGFALTLKEGAPFINIARYNANSVYEPSYSHKQTVEGLVVYREGLEQIDPDLAEGLKLMGYEKLEGNLSTDILWSEKDRLLSVEPFVAEVKDAGKLTAVKHVLAPEGLSVMDGLLEGELPLLKDVTLTFTDNSLTSRLITAIAATDDMPVQEVLLDALNQLDSMREDAYDSYESAQVEKLVGIADALENFLLQPGSLTFSLAPDQPIPANALLMAFIFDLESLNIMVSSVPGEKPLVPGFVAPPHYTPEADEFDEIPEAPEQAPALPPR